MKAILVISGTLFLAMLLSIISLPPSLLWARPEWTLMVLIFWILYAPQRCGVFLAALVGLFQDSLTASLLGKHMLAFAVVATIVVIAYKRLRMYEAWQQALVVFVLVGTAQMIENWVSLAMGEKAVGLWFLYPALVSALLWPWLVIFLRQFCRRIHLFNRIVS